MKNLLFLIMGIVILGIPLIFSLNVGIGDDKIGVDLIPTTPINYTLIPTVNATEWWITSEGNLNDVADIQGSWITNDLGWITDGNTNWDNSYGFWDTLFDDWLFESGTTLGFNSSKLTTTYYNATQSEAITGTIEGTLIDTQHPDGDYDGVTFNLTEQAGSPGLDVKINFTGITEFNRGIMRYKTSSLAGTFPIIQLWNYDDNVWEDYPAVAQSLVFATIEQSVFDDSDHVLNGVVQMRIYKATNGNINNKYYIDWIAISKGYGTPAGEEVDPYWEQDKQNYWNSTQLLNGTLVQNNTLYNNFVPYTGATSNIVLGVNITSTGRGTFTTAIMGFIKIVGNTITNTGGSADMTIQADDGLYLFGEDGGVHIGKTTKSLFIKGDNLSSVDELTFDSGGKGIQFGVSDGRLWVDSSDTMQFSSDSGDFNFNGDLIAGRLYVDTLTFNGNVISDSTGTISFGNENLTTTGNITADYFFGSGGQLTGIISDVNGTNINVLSINATSGTFNGLINATKNISLGDSLLLNSDTRLYSDTDGNILTRIVTPVGIGATSPRTKISFADIYKPSGYYVPVTSYPDTTDIGAFQRSLFVIGSASGSGLVVVGSKTKGITDYGGFSFNDDTNSTTIITAGATNDLLIQPITGRTRFGDNGFLCFGSAGCSDSNLSFDGSNLIFNTKGGQDYIFKNGTGYGKLIAHEYSVASPELSAYDGNFLDNLLSPEQMLINGKINRATLTSLEKGTEQIKDESNCWEVYDYTNYCPKGMPEGVLCNRGAPQDYNKNPKDYDVYEHTRTECGTKELNVTNIAGMQMVDRLMISELKKENDDLKNRLNSLETAICKLSPTESFCLGEFVL